MLAICGAPSRAAAAPCDPCPPDCPMMAQMAKAAGAAGHHAQVPDKGGSSEDPCKPGLACQAAFAVPLLAQTATETVLAVEAAHHDLIVTLPARSRPPDRNLRPPIQL